MSKKEEEEAPKQKIIKPQPGFQELFVRSSVDVVFGGGTLGCGKAQPDYSLVSTPYGFKEIKELKVGDVINDSTGGTQNILNIYDRGLREIIRLYFDNGNYVDCCIEHLWDIVKNAGIKTVETSYIIDSINKGNRIKIPITNPVVLKDKGNHPIHPYILGALIGDGCFCIRKCSITINTDKEIVEKFKTLSDIKIQERCDKRNGRTFFSLKSSFIRDGLEELGLMGHHSYDKFIPEQYKYTSVENRIELIRGLFDTDGYQDKKSNRVEYTTTSFKLAEDVKWIFESLGGKVTICTKIGKYKDKDGNIIECKKAYRLQCKATNLNNLFSLNRKKVVRKHDSSVWNYIVRYEKLGMTPMKCLLVSSKNHLYLTNNFIVTHNTFAAIMSVAEPSMDSLFRCCFTRRTFGELKTGGGVVDDFNAAYGDNGCSIKESNPPRVSFPSGAFVEMRQINDENIHKVTEQWKGAQFDLIYMDELTSYEFSTFKYLLTRNRGKAKWTGKFRGTTNPKKSSWVREFIDWYIDPDGQIYPDRNGVIRYFYLKGDTIKDVVWGNSKEEVYIACQIDIDRKLKALGGDFTYENMIKSFTFYLGKMSENKASIGNNMDYAGSVAAVGGGQAQQLIEGNWNADEVDDKDAPIPYHVARGTIENDPQINGDRWITCDLADLGNDNAIFVSWDGMHIKEVHILGKSTPVQNAETLKLMAQRWDVADSHLIFDGTNARYMSDYIPDAFPFLSSNHPIGMYGRAASTLKDECYLRLKYMINAGLLSWDSDVAHKLYTHNTMKEQINIITEFAEECSVVRFKEVQSGKKKLLNKREMNATLGRGRSMDLLDPIAMRMIPFLQFQYGDELLMTSSMKRAEEDDNPTKSNIYSDDFWC